MNHHDHDQDSSNDFEAQLHRQAQAEPDPAWREEILGAAMASLPAVADTAATPEHRPRFSFRLWLREWLPMPLRIPLAAAWLLIGFFTVSSQQPGTKQSSKSAKTAKANVATPATYLALRQRLSLFGPGSEDLLFSHNIRFEDL